MDPWAEYCAALARALGEYEQAARFGFNMADRMVAAEKLDAAKREAWQRYQLALELAESHHDAKDR